MTLLKQLLVPECVPASVTNEGSSEQTSTISANIIETRKRSSRTNNGPSSSEGQEKKDYNSIFKVRDLSCIAHGF